MAAGPGLIVVGMLGVYALALQILRGDVFVILVGDAGDAAVPESRVERRQLLTRAARRPAEARHILFLLFLLLLLIGRGWPSRSDVGSGEDGGDDEGRDQGPANDGGREAGGGAEVVGRAGEEGKQLRDGA